MENDLTRVCLKSDIVPPFTRDPTDLEEAYATLKAAAWELSTAIRAELEWYPERPLRTWAALDALTALVGEGE
jgi:hypothetical protein